MGCHFLLQGIFPTQGMNPRLLWLLHWQEDSLPLSHLGETKYAEPHKGMESEVAQLCQTLCEPMNCSLPGSSIHEIFQARKLEHIVIPFSS